VRGNSRQGPWILLILLVGGSILGGWIGALLGHYYPGIPIIYQSQSVGLPTTTLDLQVFTLTLGFTLRFSLLSLLGMGLGLLAYRQL